MVRRRAASPRASSPVRASAPAPVRSAPAPTSSYSRPAPAAAPASHAPAAAPTPMAGAAPSQGPGLMAQMAATAGGVAIGSAVGHTVGHMMTGGGSREAAPAPAAAAPAGAVAGQQYQSPCEFEWNQLRECTQYQNDLSLCNGLNEAFKQCQGRYAPQ